MANLQEMSNAFKFQYEKFLHGCDAQEIKGEWDVDANGEMEAYYFNDIMCIIVSLISADGTFTEEEAKYINDIFGFSYSAEELKELYRTNGADINNMIDEEVAAGYKRLKSINESLAEHYKSMIWQVCDIIAESDGIVHTAEAKQIERIKACINN